MPVKRFCSFCGFHGPNLAKDWIWNAFDFGIVSISVTETGSAKAFFFWGVIPAAFFILTSHHEWLKHIKTHIFMIHSHIEAIQNETALFAAVEGFLKLPEETIIDYWAQTMTTNGSDSVREMGAM